MTYRVGDDATRTYPVIDKNGGSIAIQATVTAANTAGDEIAVTAEWATAAAPLPGVDGATFRDIDIPFVDLPAGLWGFTLNISGAADLFLGNVVIE